MGALCVKKNLYYGVLFVFPSTMRYSNAMERVQHGVYAEIAHNDEALVGKIREQLAQDSSYYGRCMADLYDDVVREHDAQLQEHEVSRLSRSSWDDTHMALVTLGVHQDDAILVNASTHLLEKPSHKWEAAVWVTKQNGGLQLDGDCARVLGEADAAASTDSKEALAVDLAKLDLELYKLAYAPKAERESQWQAMDEQTHALDQILEDPEAFTVQQQAQARLQVARLFRAYDHNGQAKQIRKHAGHAPSSELRAYDQVIEQQRQTNFVVRLGRKAIDLLPDLHAPRGMAPEAVIRSRLLTVGERHEDDMERFLQPAAAFARAPQMGEIGVHDLSDEYTIETLDVLLRAGAFERAQKSADDILAYMHMGTFMISLHRGVGMQALALMRRYGVEERSATNAAEADEILRGLEHEMPSVHNTAAEDGKFREERAQEASKAAAHARLVSDIPERVKLLMRIEASLRTDGEVQGKYAKEVLVDIYDELQYAWTLWHVTDPDHAAMGALRKDARSYGIKTGCHVVPGLTGGSKPCGSFACKAVCSARDRD
jgi:hypothetical protein